MHSSKITIKTGESVSLPADGSLVVFESGTSSTANNYIIVKGESGSEIRLKQGQGMRAERSRTWQFRCEDTAATITANIIIGDGDFNDSAVNATIAGAVIVTSGTVQTAAGSETKINNTDAQAVPVRNQKLATITQGTAAVGMVQVAINADTDLKTITVRNNHATAQIAIGLTGVTLTTAAIVLQPNDVWETERMAGASWFAISDIAGGSIAWIKGKE
ncbi:MAG: hypothetical protein ACEQSE_00930 [Candidatus Aquirickettsiella gammari]